MEHILNNPAWNALNSGNKIFSTNNNRAAYFPPEASPFCGLAENNAGNFGKLYEISPVHARFGFISPVKMEIPVPWKTVQCMEVLQMVCNEPARQPETDEQLIPLTQADVPAMLALTQLTNPGPFASRTIEFGHYKGIFDDNRLVAMAGQRLNPLPYAEVSAVCTHPAYLGRGYAAQLIADQIRRISTAGQTPFLHVLTKNVRAINLYQSLGFISRREMAIYIIRK